MEDGVHPVLLGTDTIQNSSDGVSNTSGQKHEESRLGQNFQGLREKEDDTPPHTDIADHGKDIVFLQIDGRQGDGHRKQTPLCCQQSPANQGIHRNKCGQQDGRIGACDQEVDRAVVNDL